MLNWLKSASASYLSHLSGYIVAGATIVSGINPKALPPQYAFLTALAGIVVNAAHHGFTLANASPALKAALDVAVKAGIDSANTAVTAAAPAAKALAVVLVLPLLMTLHGCATVTGWFNSPQAQPVIVAAVDVAVATAEQKGVSATQINDVAKQALVANQSTSATLATVAAVVNQQIAKLNLPAGDLASVQILEVALAAEIQSRIGTNADLAAARAAVADVLNAVIEATGG